MMLDKKTVGNYFVIRRGDFLLGSLLASKRPTNVFDALMSVDLKHETLL